MTTNDLYIAINAMMAEISSLQNEYMRQTEEDPSLNSKFIIRKKIKSLRTEINEKLTILINMNPFGEESLSEHVKHDIHR